MSRKVLQILVVQTEASCAKKQSSSTAHSEAGCAKKQSLSTAHSVVVHGVEEFAAQAEAEPST